MKFIDIIFHYNKSGHECKNNLQCKPILNLAIIYELNVSKIEG